MSEKLRSNQKKVVLLIKKLLPYAILFALGTAKSQRFLIPPNFPQLFRPCVFIIATI